MREIAIGIASWRDALIHLDDVHALPGHFLLRQRAQHDPRRVPSAHGDHEAPVRRHSVASFGGDESRSRFGHCLGVIANLDPHWHAYFFTTGLFQPSGGASWSAWLGPHVPGW